MKIHTKSAEIRAYLEGHYSCAAMPYGELTTVAKRFGVTKELVRHISRDLQFTPAGKIGRLRATCPDCGGRKHPTSERCRECWSASRWLTLTCDNPTCGKVFRRRLSRIIARQNNQRYTSQDAFCSHACFEATLGPKMRAVRAVKKWSRHVRCPECGSVLVARRCPRCDAAGVA